MQCKQSYPDLPRMPPSQKQKISSVQESNEEEDESLEALANNGSMMEGKITNKVRMQHAKTGNFNQKAESGVQFTRDA